PTRAPGRVAADAGKLRRLPKGGFSPRRRASSIVVFQPTSRGGNEQRKRRWQQLPRPGRKDGTAHTDSTDQAAVGAVDSARRAADQGELKGTLNASESQEECR